MWYRILVIVSVVILVLTAVVWIAVERFKPTYQGEQVLSGLIAEVEVMYDAHGVPHIYAASEQDAFYALGWVHAQDRLFQMEMLRRLSSGRLSEVLGKDLLESDQFFRTLGFANHAESSVFGYWDTDIYEPWQENTLAYLEGLNAFIEQGPTPLEFLIAGIPKQPFLLEDIYLVDLFMAFGFAEGFREDPLLTFLSKQVSQAHLGDLLIDWDGEKSTIPVWPSESIASLTQIGNHTASIMDRMPIAPWHGSNGWVIGPAKTAGGKVLFANDTHMGYSQPSVWYEAHLEAPGLSFYGNFAAGRPFPVLGHNRYMAMGLTMFENDDTDFYVLRAAPNQPDRYMWDGLTITYDVRTEVIKVKDEDDFILEVKESLHGPIINEIVPGLSLAENQAVAVHWSPLHLPNENLQATYQVMKAQSMAEAKSAISQINAPGLNVMYGDVDGNIAWWTTARLWDRAAGVSGKFFIDGSRSSTLPEWRDWSLNPHAENPPSGYVYSANNQPEGVDGSWYPGYYVPENRAKRIIQLLEEDNAWTVDKVKAMINDVQADTDAEILHHILPYLKASRPLEEHALRELYQWTGAYTLDNLAGGIYNLLIYFIQQYAMEDEMGTEGFKLYMGTHLQKRSLADLIANPNSLWWDNVNTPQKEERADIFNQAFQKAIAVLETERGADPENWKWRDLHTVEHPHPFGQIQALRSTFNVGPLSIPGANEVINNTGFKPDSTSHFKVLFGPAMRRVIDMGDIARSWSVLPTGQSGHLLSPFYRDQAEMYARGDFRGQWMDRTDIERERRYRLLLKPE